MIKGGWAERFWTVIVFNQDAGRIYQKRSTSNAERPISSSQATRLPLTAVELMHRKRLTIDAWEGFRTSVQKRKWEQSSLLTQEVANGCRLMPERVSAVLSRVLISKENYKE